MRRRLARFARRYPLYLLLIPAVFLMAGCPGGSGGGYKRGSTARELPVGRSGGRDRRLPL